MATTVVDPNAEEVNALAIGLMVLVALFIIGLGLMYITQRTQPTMTLHDSDARLYIPLPLPSAATQLPMPRLDIVIPRKENLIPHVTKPTVPSSDIFGDPDSLKAI